MTSTEKAPKEPLQFRGRNGWVRYDSHRVAGMIGAHDPIVVELFSRRLGEYPPFVLLGEREEVRALLLQVVAEIDQQTEETKPAEILTALQEGA